MTERSAFTNKRRRWRPRSTASGAGAGPSTVDAGQMRRGAGQRAGGEIGVLGIVGADDQRRQAAEGRQPRRPPLRRLGFEKASRSPAASA